MPSKRFVKLIIPVYFLLPILLAACTPSDRPSARETPPASSTAAPEGVVEYRDPAHGFRISLPETWRGFSIRLGDWQGMKIGDQGDEAAASGPLVAIVHPDATPQEPRQDIPIMVFTRDQWSELQNGDWHIGAAPIGPSELGRNSRYVLALPARYNYAFPEGWEEVEQILKGQPLATFEPTAGP
jgi:hypothetical protein